MFCMLGRHSGDVWQTLHDKTGCGPLVVTAGLGAVTCIDICLLKCRLGLYSTSHLEQAIITDIQSNNVQSDNIES
jgi:hypothetical protein